MDDVAPSGRTGSRRLPAPGDLADRYYREHREAIELCFDLRRTARIALAASDRFLAAFRLTDVAMAVLLELRRSPDAAPAALADRAGVRPTTLAMILQRLEAEGWITRSRHPHDGRRRCVRLSDAGRSRLDILLRDVYEIATAQLTPLSADDRVMLRRLLALIRTASPPPPRRSWWVERGLDPEEPFHEWELWEEAREKGG